MWFMVLEHYENAVSRSEELKTSCDLNLESSDPEQGYSKGKPLDNIELRVPGSFPAFIPTSTNLDTQFTPGQIEG